MPAANPTRRFVSVCSALIVSAAVAAFAQFTGDAPGISAAAIPVNVLVRTSAGPAPSGVVVVAISSSRSIVRATTNGNGTAGFSLTAPDTYDFTIDDPSGLWTLDYPVDGVYVDTSGNSDPVAVLDVHRNDVVGKVVAADGSSVAGGHVELFRPDYSYDAMASIGPTGTFAIELFGATSGSYYLRAQPPSGSLLLPSDPKLVTVTVSATGTVAGAPVSVGTIALTTPVKLIRGVIRRLDGGTVGPAIASASSTTEGGIGESVSTPVVTATNTFTLGVRGGPWAVGIAPDYDLNPSADWVYSAPPIDVAFAADSAPQTKYVTFTVSGPQVTGRVAAADGSDVTYSAVELFNRDRSVNLLASADVSGTFKLSGIERSGTYYLVAHPPQQGALLSSDPMLLTATVGASGSVVITTTLHPTGTISRAAPFDVGVVTLNRPVKLIRGVVRRSDGRSLGATSAYAFSASGGEPGEDFFSTSVITTTNQFTLGVKPGTWSITVDPDSIYNADPDWVYTGEAVSVSFAEPEVAETKYVTFTVTPAPHIVRGNVRLPNGSLPPDDTVEVSLSDNGGFGRSAAVTNGIFALRVPTGTYAVDVWSSNPRFGPPAGGIPPVSVPVSSTASAGALTRLRIASLTPGRNRMEYDVGTIVLADRSSAIRGRVKDDLGNGLTDISVGAWNPLTDESVDTVTDPSGQFTLWVGGGAYQVDAFPSASQRWARRGGPRSVSVQTSSEQSGVDFTLVPADSAVTVRAVDASGQLLADAQGFVFARKQGLFSVSAVKARQAGEFADGEPLVPGVPLERGVATLYLPATTNIVVGVDFPPGSRYLFAESRTVTTTRGVSSTVAVTVGQPDATISGVITSRGSPVTGLRAQIFASYADTSAPADVDPATGRYSIRVSSGRKWYMSISVDPATGYFPSPGGTGEVDLTSMTVGTYDFELERTDGRVAGVVRAPSGAPIAGAFVWASIPASGTVPPRFVAYSVTDADGRYEIVVPIRQSYEIRADSALTSLISPAAKLCALGNGGTCAVDLQFRSPDAVLSGKVLSGTLGVEALVRAWSDNGGDVAGFSGADGTYALNIVNGDVWHVGAVYERSGFFAVSDEQIITTTTSSIRIRASTYTQTLTIRSPVILPAGQTVTFDATSPQTINLANGVKITIPAGALATRGQVTVRATPKALLAGERNAHPLDFGYALEATDASGRPIAKFNQNVRIEMAYDRAKLPPGVDEERLIPSYYDNATATWRCVPNFAIDKTNRRVIALVDHFTDFAIMSSAPPVLAPASSQSNTAYLPAVLNAFLPGGW